MNRTANHFSKGFTLIEVLVVILIMGVVMSMISLTSTTPDPLENVVKKTQALQYWFGKAIDQSLLSGDDVGLYVTQSEVVPMSWRDGDIAIGEPETVWEPYAALETFIIPEDIDVELYLDIELSNWVELELTPPEERLDLIPHIVITPSEEYFPSFSINIYSNDYSDEYMRIFADGFNRVKVFRE